MSAIRTVIVGTAGHIDHGKSSVVLRLTGVDPDRLAEERERGMTIDLGFAPYRHASGATVGMIDVPGHERFIKNMVAGATSVDLALLVVAADDGVMPQTREHLSILELLGVQRGVVVLSKIDLVDAELAALAEEELREFLSDTCLAEAPLIPVSCLTGEGFDALRTTLDEQIALTRPRESAGPFRLPVQRVFSAKGHGLVVTGVPVSGSAEAGEHLEIVRTGRRVRVRSVQAYGQERSSVAAGHSSALNLAGATTDDVHRGDVVAEPGAFRATRFVALSYQHVIADTPLRPRHPVRLHAGTAEVLGRAVILDAESTVEQGGARVQLRLDEPVCCAVGDRVLMRDAASMQVLGGGVVLALTDGRLKRLKDRVLAELGAREEALGDPGRLAEAVLGAAGPRGVLADELALECGMAAGDLLATLQPALAAGRLVRSGSLLTTAAALEAVADEIVARLKPAHRARPLLDWLDQAAVLAGMPHDDVVLRAAIAHDPRLETAAGGKLRRHGHRGRLGPELASARARLAEVLRAAGACPPVIDAGATGLSAADTGALLELMREERELVRVGQHDFLREVFDGMRRTLVAHAGSRDGAIDIPVLRDELGTTRKYLIPLLEAFDAEGLTVRHGDRRLLRRREGPA